MVTSDEVVVVASSNSDDEDVVDVGVELSKDEVSLVVVADTNELVILEVVDVLDFLIT